MRCLFFFVRRNRQLRQRRMGLWLSGLLYVLGVRGKLSQRAEQTGLPARRDLRHDYFERRGVGYGGEEVKPVRRLKIRC